MVQVNEAGLDAPVVSVAVTVDAGGTRRGRRAGNQPGRGVDRQPGRKPGCGVGECLAGCRVARLDLQAGRGATVPAWSPGLVTVMVLCVAGWT